MAYSLLQENPKPTVEMVEDNFDGHICRCTGKCNCAKICAVCVISFCFFLKVIVPYWMQWRHLLQMARLIQLPRILKYASFPLCLTFTLLSLSLSLSNPSFHQDLGSTPVLCPSTGELCKGHCRVRVRERAESDPLWFCPSSLEELAALYNANSDKRIKLVAGDTGRGEFRRCKSVS